MGRMKQLFTALLAALCMVQQAMAASLPQTVRDELRRASIPLSSVGIVVQDQNAGTPLVSLNADLAMNPASTMKLLTTLASLEMLGPAYRWKTEAYLDGRLENGVLQGNLVFKGYGDPKLTIEQFWMWLREMRQRGLREIRGDVVLDRSFFGDIDHDPAEFDNDPTRAYNVGPNALLLNFNALHLRLIPNATSTSALLEPDLSGYMLSNRVTTVARRPCAGGDTYTAHLEDRSIVLEGTIPVDCGEVDDYLSLLPHGDYFFAVFSALWKEMGGTLQGGMREGIAPADQQPFSTHWSAPLSEVIRDINKFSNNIMARQLFLTLGTSEAEFAHTGGANPAHDLLPLDDVMALLSFVDVPFDPVGLDYRTADDLGAGVDSSAANIPRSIAAIRTWLSSEHMEFPELVLENGAGLSRRERISPQHLAELLQFASSSRYAAELVASLPILGMDGTMKRRFKDNEISGYAHIKTGMLEGVKSIAGYVKSHSGKQWIVVFFINHPKASFAQTAQDALIEWLQKQY